MVAKISPHPTRSRCKRALDVTVAAVGLVATAPILAASGLLIAAFIGRPIIFRHRRPGLHGRPFELLKLRTMTLERGADGILLPDAERLPPLGRALRALSLDELPQFVNVLRGEMSLVGPRPLLMDYLARYTPEQARRHEVLPGITGWAQINGRNALGWPEKFALDVWYVDHWTFWLDVKILFRTATAVVRRRGVTRSGCATTVEFTGTDTHESVPFRLKD